LRHPKPSPPENHPHQKPQATKKPHHQKSSLAKIFTALSPHQVQDALQMVSLRENVYQVRLLYAITGG
jgi:hypothetical protein